MVYYTQKSSMEPTQLGIWPNLDNPLRAHDHLIPFGMDKYKMLFLLSRFKLLFYSIVFQLNMDNHFFPISRRSRCIGRFNINPCICLVYIHRVQKNQLSCWNIITPLYRVAPCGFVPKYVYCDL